MVKGVQPGCFLFNCIFFLSLFFIGSILASLVSESGPSGWPKSCPTGYSQHLGAIEEDCEINFCVKANSFNKHGLPIIKRPPYSSPPKIFNYSVPLLLVNHDTGQIWFKRPNSFQWSLATKRYLRTFLLVSR